MSRCQFQPERGSFGENESGAQNLSAPSHHESGFFVCPEIGRDAALRRPVSAARGPYSLTSRRPNLVWRFVISAVAAAANYGQKKKI